MDYKEKMDENVTLAVSLLMNSTNSSTDELTTSGGQAPPPQRFAPPPGLVSAEVTTQVTEAVYCYILPILVLFGTCGNVMSIVVLFVEKKRDTTNMSLTALAVSDTGLVLTSFARNLSCILGKFDAALGRNYMVLMYAQMMPINICFTRITSIITAIISTERCLAVVLPLKVRDIVTRTRMGVALILSFALTFLLLGPVFASAESYWVKNPRTNTSYVKYSLTKFYLDHKEFNDAYRDIFLNAVFRFLPTGLVIFNTVIIIVRLQRSSSWRGDSSSASKNRVAKERKLTNMLLTLCGIYIFCTLPGFMFQCFTFATDDFSIYGRYRNMYRLTSSISTLSQFLNSSVNFIVYMALNERFAQTYIRLFCPCRKAGKDGKSEDSSKKTNSSKPATATTRAITSKSEKSQSDALPNNPVVNETK